MKEMTWRILSGSFRCRQQRVAVSICAVALGASLIVAAVNLRQGIKGKLAEELRHYGANLLVVAGAGIGPFLKQKELIFLEDRKATDRLLGYVPFLYSLANIQGKDVVLGGTDFAAVKKLNPWWQVDGSWPEGERAALVGANVASKLGLGLGDRLSVVYKNFQTAFTVSGILRSGGAEENQVFVRLESLQLLTGHQGLLSSVFMTSRTVERLEETAALLRQAWPDAEVRTLWQVAKAEQALLSRLETFLLLVGLLVLFSSGLSVFATMTTSALERKVEMALMRALGARESEVTRIFASEALGIGMIGGLLGSVLGFLFAEAVSLNVFRSLVLPSLLSLPVGLGIGIGISLSSSLSVLMGTAALAPAAVLRGE